MNTEPQQEEITDSEAFLVLRVLEDGSINFEVCASQEYPVLNEVIGALALIGSTRPDLIEKYARLFEEKEEEFRVKPETVH